MRRLWRGETLSYGGPVGHFKEVAISGTPIREPFDVWLGGMARSSLERCGRLDDGWLPSVCSPQEAAAGRLVVAEAAAAAGRFISEEHFGVSIGHANAKLDGETRAVVAARARGSSIEDIAPMVSTR